MRPVTIIDEYHDTSEDWEVPPFTPLKSDEVSEKDLNRINDLLSRTHKYTYKYKEDVKKSETNQEYNTLLQFIQENERT